MIPGKKKLGVCIVMELCEMGDLTAYLKDMRDVKRGVVSETVALAWIEQVSSGWHSRSSSNPSQSTCIASDSLGPAPSRHSSVHSRLSRA